MARQWDENDRVDAVALAWLRERPGTPVDGVGIVTRIWQCAKLLGEDRRHVLAAAGADAATLDLLSVLRRSGAPYQLTTRELAERTQITAGAISQRVARAEREGLAERRSAQSSRTVTVAPIDGGETVYEYDHVVVGLGAVTRTFPTPGLAEHGETIGKREGDAIQHRLRQPLGRGVVVEAQEPAAHFRVVVRRALTARAVPAGQVRARVRRPRRNYP